MRQTFDEVLVNVQKAVPGLRDSEAESGMKRAWNDEQQVYLRELIKNHVVVAVDDA